MEKSTGDLLNELKNVKGRDQLDEYLDRITDIAPGSFAEYVWKHLNEKGMKRSELLKASFIDKSYFYDIMNGSKNPSKDKVIAIALAAGWDLTLTQRGLEIAGDDILYSKNQRDSLIIYAINNHMDVRSTNALLADYNEKELA